VKLPKRRGHLPVAASSVIQSDSGIDTISLRRVLRRLPALDGRSIVIARAANLRDRSGPVHGGAFLRERRILFDCTRAEFPRIFVHELFHFVWLRAGNPARIAFERLVAAELEAGVRGELGWAAESRKGKLTAADPGDRTRRWRDYCCESFCDTAAWLYSGLAGHPEFTLGTSWRHRRRAWFESALDGRKLSI
jgi:hypothetical protein